MQAKFKHLLVICIILFETVVSVDTSAQERNNSWYRVSLRYDLVPKTSLTLEAQSRRQSATDNLSLFSNNLMYSLRPWLSYRPDSKWKLSASPLAWYRLYSIISKEEDKYKAPIHECRSSLSAVHKQKV